MSTVDTFSTACEMLGALRRREISAVELLALHLAQIERRNAALNAIVIPDFEAACRAAEAADRRRGHGEDAPLLGLPYTVKDWIEVAGLRSTAGDPNMAHYRATADSRVVSRLRAAGAVLLGKTNMAPWGDDFVTDNPVFGRTVNPWNPDYTPGGSTGGGAAAVAAGLTPLEIGNDIGGSVRIPPAFCGAYGHKPSETALPRTGQTPDPSGLHLPNPASGLAVIGPLARSADDLELALDVASGPDQGEDIAWRLAIPPARAGRLADFRVAVLAPMRWLPMDSEIVAAGDRLAAGLARLGARVERVEDGAFGNTRDLYKL
jgi:amidase